MSSSTAGTTGPAAEALAAVPFVNLRFQHDQIADEIMPALEEVMARTAFVLGPQVDTFEAEYAAFCGAQHCVGVGNGTDAIELALRAAGVGPGDEVIIPANTFVATAEAVIRAGSQIVLADCDDDFLISAASVGQALSPRTKAVISVDLYGQMPDVDAIRAVLPDSVQIIEDAAQSQGASRNGQAAGTIGSVAATSFYPGKNLGAYGDAGAVITDDHGIADRVRSLRSHGGQLRYQHDLVGTNSRLDTLQAVVLSAKLRRLHEWNDARRAAAARYEQLLGDIDELVLPRTLPGNVHVWHLYVVRVDGRDEVLSELGQHGIGAGIHYPKPVHELGAFEGYDFGSADLSRSEQLAGQILSLPMFPGITEEQQMRVVSVLTEALIR